jgi:hypothetical protein
MPVDGGFRSQRERQETGDRNQDPHHAFLPNS